MDVKRFIELLDADFYTGIPDSQLKPLCNYLTEHYGYFGQHIIAANEGNCASLAAGYYLATGKVPVVYLQNSGIGNIINPSASLLNKKVYAIPCIFIVGWRGEPGVPDEPQHIYQGEVTIRLLEDMDIKTYVISKDTKEEDVKKKLSQYRALLAQGKSVAFVIRKQALEFDGNVVYSNSNRLFREEVIEKVTDISGQDVIVSTTGKASRELYEIRDRKQQPHKYDFLTVGSMGHSSSIALGIALNKINTKVWCIDGDGAVIMHMGAIAVIGAQRPNNLVHVVINNGAHETVGGMSTAAGKISLAEIAYACGYEKVESVDNLKDLEQALTRAKKSDELYFIEVRCAIGARNDLGRPKKSAEENRMEFMDYLASLD